MIDIHCHILPGLDDGAGDAEECVEMCRMATSDGIGTVVATPHTLNGVYENDRAAILPLVARLNEYLKGQGIALSVLPGADTHLDPEVVGAVADGRATTINDTGRLILVEMPNFFIPEYVKRQVFELSLRGVAPVISHPERNEVMLRGWELLGELVDGGALVQLTAGSLMGRFGAPSRKYSLRAIEAGLAHAVATDAHNTGGRPPILSEAYGFVADEYGEDTARYLFIDAPGRIVQGLKPDSPRPVKRRGRSFMSLFRRG